MNGRSQPRPIKATTWYGYPLPSAALNWNQILVWDLQDGAVLHTQISSLYGSTNDFALHPNGKILVTNDMDSLKYWDINTGEIIETFSGYLDIRYFDFSPDGRRLITAHNDRTIKIWD